MSGYNLRGTAGDSRAGGRDTSEMWSEQNCPFTVLSEGESVQTPSALRQQQIHEAQEYSEHIPVTKARVAPPSLRRFAQVSRWPWTVPHADRRQCLGVCRGSCVQTSPQVLYGYTTISGTTQNGGVHRRWGD